MKLFKYFSIFLLTLSINGFVIGVNGKKFSKSKTFIESTHAWAKYVVIVGIIHKNGFQHYCTGGVINSIAVLTVAQCIALIPKVKQLDALHIVAGTPIIFDNLKDVIPLTQIVQVKEVKLHEQFKEILVEGKNISYWRTYNNLAVLQLQRALNIDKNTVDILSLPVKKATTTTLCATLGWPHLYEKGPHSDRIYYHSLNIVDEQQCKDFYEHHGYDKLCLANYTNIDENLKYFDLGAPLICQGELTGITGYDYGNASLTSESNIFVDVLLYTDWIKSHIPFMINYVTEESEKSNQNYQVSYNFITYIIELASILFVSYVNF